LAISSIILYIIFVFAPIANADIDIGSFSILWYFANVSPWHYIIFFLAFTPGVLHSILVGVYDHESSNASFDNASNTLKGTFAPLTVSTAANAPLTVSTAANAFATTTCDTFILVPSFFRDFPTTAVAFIVPCAFNIVILDIFVFVAVGIIFSFIGIVYSRTVVVAVIMLCPAFCAFAFTFNFIFVLGITGIVFFLPLFPSAFRHFIAIIFTFTFTLDFSFIFSYFRLLFAAFTINIAAAIIIPATMYYKKSRGGDKYRHHSCNRTYHHSQNFASRVAPHVTLRLNRRLGF